MQKRDAVAGGLDGKSFGERLVCCARSRGLVEQAVAKMSRTAGLRNRVRW